MSREQRAFSLATTRLPRLFFGGKTFNHIALLNLPARSLKGCAYEQLKRRRMNY